MKEGVKESRIRHSLLQKASQRAVGEMLNAVDAGGPRCPRVPLISVKDRKLRTQFAKEHHDWTIEGLKTGRGKKNAVWSDESRFPP